MWHSIRHRLVPALRWKHWASLFLAVGITAALAELMKDTASSDDAASVVSRTAFVLGIALKIKELFGSFRIWRWLRPHYRGLDEFLRRIDGSPLFSSAFITPEAGHVVIDAVAVIERLTTMLPRVDFVGGDPALNAIAAQINADAFRGTLYHATAEAKLRRNQPLARLHPASFARIRAAGEGYSHNGLAVVLPMNRQGLSAYLAGKLSDNDIAPRHLSRPGQRPEALLVFLIANAGAGRRDRTMRYLDMLDTLIQLCIVQIIAIAAAARQSRDVRVIVANAEPKWGVAFERMQFVPCPEYDSADQQFVYECRLTLKDPQAAMRAAVAVARGLGDAATTPAPLA